MDFHKSLVFVLVFATLHRQSVCTGQERSWQWDVSWCLEQIKVVRDLCLTVSDFNGKQIRLSSKWMLVCF